MRNVGGEIEMRDKLEDKTERAAYKEDVSIE